MSPDPASIPTPPTTVPDSGLSWRRTLLVAFGAAALSTFFFAPRFVVWRSLGVPGPGSNIEVFRAPWFLAQVAQPFDKIENESNVVIQWRMLFPLLAHYLHLPRLVLMALPWIGCLSALALVARILWAHSRDLRLVWLGTAMMATCAWYLIGTGWVLYFDGWLMATMLLATFGRARWQLFLAAFLAPWIDERFVLTLPLLVTVRWVFLAAREPEGFREIARDVGTLALGLLPYLGSRGLAWKFDVLQPTQGFFESFFKNSMGFNNPAWVTLLGAWHGLRAAWLPVLALPVLVARSQGVLRSWVLGLTAFFSMVVLLGLAGDINRSASMAAPMLLAALIMLWTSNWPGQRGRVILIWICAANFFLPTKHVVTSNPLALIRVNYLHEELRQLREPPDQFNPKFYFAVAQQAMQAQKPQDALNHLSTAIGLDPEFADALVSRGVLFFNEAIRLQKAGNQPDSEQFKTRAMSDLNQAAASPQAGFGVWLNRGLARRELGDKPGAAMDLEQALALAPSDWPERAQVAQILADLKAGR